jgi:hypothetical protein
LHNFVNNALYGHVYKLSKPVEIVNMAVNMNRESDVY